MQVLEKWMLIFRLLRVVSNTLTSIIKAVFKGFRQNMSFTAHLERLTPSGGLIFWTYARSFSGENF